VSDNVQFSGTGWSPPENTTVATDYVGIGGGGSAHFQRVKLDIGADGATSPVTDANPLPLGTLSGGTVQLYGTAQVLGTYQPLAGSVHVANAISGTFQAHGTAQVLGTVRALVDAGTAQTLGTYQPLAGSVHPAAALPGTSHITGTVRILDPAQVAQSGAWSVAVTGTAQALGTYQPLAGSVHVANGLSGTFQPHGTGQALGTYQPLAGSVHVANVLFGTFQPHGTAQTLGTVRIVDPAAVTQSGAWSVAVSGTVQAHGTTQALGTVQPLAGSVHVANTLSGTFQPHGTAQSLGTIQPLAGSVHPAAALPGTSQISGTVREAGAPTWARTKVAAGTETATFIGANAARRGVAVMNDATTILYLALGSLAGTIDYSVKMQPGAYFETPYGYTGTLSGLWAPGTAAAGTAYLTEVS
jgi:hypothetical protein